MSFLGFDHVALEVADLDRHVEALVSTGALRVRRYGTVGSGHRMVLLGDGDGLCLELIEHPDAKEPRFAHLALRCADSDVAEAELVANGWRSERPSHELPRAHARTALLRGSEGMAVQVIAYRPTSPDLERCSD